VSAKPKSKPTFSAFQYISDALILLGLILKRKMSSKATMRRLRPRVHQLKTRGRRRKRRGTRKRRRKALHKRRGLLSQSKTPSNRQNQRNKAGSRNLRRMMWHTLIRSSSRIRKSRRAWLYITLESHLS
jgi:hypothetical protein